MATRIEGWDEPTMIMVGDYLHRFSNIVLEMDKVEVECERIPVRDPQRSLRTSGFEAQIATHEVLGR